MTAPPAEERARLRAGQLLGARLALIAAVIVLFGAIGFFLTYICEQLTGDSAHGMIGIAAIVLGAPVGMTFGLIAGIVASRRAEDVRRALRLAGVALLGTFAISALAIADITLISGGW